MRLWKSLNKRLYRNFAGITIYKRKGHRLILDPYNHVDFRIIARLPFEDEQIAKSRAIVQAYGINTVLDIGANIGLYTVELASLGPVEAVHAFEPVRSNFNQLCGNIYLNGLSSKVEAHRLALGSADSTAQIFIEPKSTGRSRFDPLYSGNPEAFTTSESVQIRRLDEYLFLKGKKLLVKIDVEGHALEVLKGMRQTLQNNHAIIQAELLEFDRSQIIQCLAEYGYVLFDEVDVDGYFMPAGDRALIPVADFEPISKIPWRET